MKQINKPVRSEWSALIERPGIERKSLEQSIRSILDDVRRNKDNAVLRYTKILDGPKLDSLSILESECKKASLSVPEELKKAIAIAKQNIEVFHRAQQESETIVKTSEGVECWRKNVGIERVGLYIPGGSAPLFSTILMLGIPAQLAGCKEVVLCTPPDKNGKVNPVILYTAGLVGISEIYCVGGAQAIGAMAYGTESIRKVDKIFGPGNQFVTKAKEIVQQSGVAIDMPAGPSEVLIIADSSCVPEFVAADLLSQAEHGADSQVILLSDDEEVKDKVLRQLEEQLKRLPRKETAEKALLNSKAIVLDSVIECIEFSNLYAPEHLIIASDKAIEYAENIVNAGSVFLGNYSCESAGDYASGTNHTLPTNGYARNYSGVSLDSFVKKITFQQLSAEGIRTIGPAIELMAEAEKLFAHKNAVSIRLKTLENE